MSLKATAPSPVIRWSNRVLDFSQRPLVMGILNITPDSFYEQSRLFSPDKALTKAQEMIQHGADIIDVGGESTRPASRQVSIDEELKRVIPVIQELRKKSDIIISIDTMKKEVAEEALKQGADMANCVSGLKNDEAFGRLLAKRQIPVILMHMRGTPQTMQNNPFYKDTIIEIKAELNKLVQNALSWGITKEKIIIDPGIGFGKRLEDNLKIIKNLDQIKNLGYPLLIGVSRKSFIGLVLDKPAEQRLIGTITANTVAILQGADIVRVHDVKQAVEMVKIIAAIKNI